MSPSDQIGFGLKTERSRLLFDYWDKSRGCNLLPNRSDIDPTHIPDLLSCLSLLEHRSDGLFWWRLVGTDLVRLYGHDPTNKAFDQPGMTRHDRRFIKVLAGVTDEPCGSVVHCKSRTTIGRDVEIEQLYLPLLDHSGKPSIVLGHTAFVEPGLHAFHDVGSVRELAIDNVQRIKP